VLTDELDDEDDVIDFDATADNNDDV